MKSIILWFIVFTLAIVSFVTTIPFYLGLALLLAFGVVAYRKYQQRRNR